jgi:hypothetical protein
VESDATAIALLVCRFAWSVVRISGKFAGSGTISLSGRQQNYGSIEKCTAIPLDLFESRKG